MIELRGISVLVITYNHEKFIDECLAGIVMQKGIDLMEIVVADDCSTDGTRALLQAWQAKDPRIKLILNEKNLGVARNFVKGWRACQHKYVAFCEGDDFWIDPDKLRKQLFEFAIDSTVSLVYTNYHKMDENRELLQKSVLIDQPIKFKLEDLIMSHGPRTNTVMLKRSVIPENLPASFFSVLNPDDFIFAYALTQGYGKFCDFAGSVYRLHGGGIWSSLEKTEQKMIRYTTRLALLRSLKPDQWRSHMDEIMRLFHAEMSRAFVTDRALYAKYSGKLSAYHKNLIRLRAGLGRLRKYRR